VGAPVPSGITALTGISSDLLEARAAEGTALLSWRRSWPSTASTRWSRTTRASFRGFLERAWREHGLTPALPPFLCSVRTARRYVRAPRYGLDQLVEQLGIPGRARHRALGDAEMTADLWIELCGRARLAGVHTLESLRAQAEVKTGRAPRSRIRVVEVSG
jgi:DNA polymerase-3 subunit epsilon